MAAWRYEPCGGLRLLDGETMSPLPRSPPGQRGPLCAGHVFIGGRPKPTWTTRACISPTASLRAHFHSVVSLAGHHRTSLLAIPMDCLDEAPASPYEPNSQSTSQWSLTKSITQRQSSPERCDLGVLGRGYRLRSALPGPRQACDALGVARR